jgi:hypothetical protein
MPKSAITGASRRRFSARLRCCGIPLPDKDGLRFEEASNELNNKLEVLGLLFLPVTRFFL